MCFLASGWRLAHRVCRRHKGLRRTSSHIRFVAEYQETEERAKLTLSYGGEKMDPADSEDQLSYTMLKQSVDEMNYRYDPDAELPNQVEIRIKES